MNKKVLLFVFIAPLLGISLAAGRIYYLATIKSYQGEEKLFTVSRGEAFSQINARLSKEKLIPSAKLFHHYCKRFGLMNKMKVGKYRIKKGMSLVDIAKLIASGDSETIKITIPEGTNIYELGKMLEEKGIVKASDFIKEAKRLEGKLFPETYQFSEGENIKTILTAMNDLFIQKTKALDFSRTKLSKDEVLVMASIVEKETGKASERRTIAGVFFNRLKKGMRLQSDPTTIYGIFERFDGNLRKKDLLEKTPYNTYKIKALPPGPICNPGLEAIKAVLNPEKHDFLYFVSRNDGSHIFTRTYREHQKEVQRYQLRRQK